MHRKGWAFGALLMPPMCTAWIVWTLFSTTLHVAVLVGVFSAFGSCDLWYFLRMGITSFEFWLDRQFIQHRRALFDLSELHGRILLNDIDRNAHCNNARFLRECGFGRRDLWHYNGVWEIICSHGGNLVVGAQTVRYRRELSLGQRYVLQTRVVCWDARAFYVEHRFITPGNQPFVNAIVLVKNTVLGPLSPTEIIEQLQPKEMAATPPMPQDVALWIQSNQVSSTMLRKEASDGTKQQ